MIPLSQSHQHLAGSFAFCCGNFAVKSVTQLLLREILEFVRICENTKLLNPGGTAEWRPEIILYLDLSSVSST